MPLIYITGIPGVGKSTVVKELTKRGYESYSADEDGFNWWYDRDTNKAITYKPSDKEAHTPQWTATCAWRTSREKVKKLAEKADKKIIFLSGSSENEKEIWNLFSKVIGLVVDDSTLHARIDQRTTN